MLSPRSHPTAAPGADPATATATADPADAGRPPRGPRPPRPRYEPWVLLSVTALAAVLCTWGIDHSVYHTFYAAAVRSMTGNPVAFFFGSFDPGNSITLDKEPGFLWPQALSAMVFGFHPWALVVPQAVEAVACVVLLHILVRRWVGVPAGLLAAAFLALTPVTVGLGRSIVEDAPFVLLLLLAAEATWRATRRARLRTLLAAGVWVGVAFQCKMLEAWAVLPALAVTYLVAAPTTLWRRIWHVAVAGAVTVAVSVSWMAVVTAVPAQDRPYVDGTTDNSAYSMIVGYNFLTRFRTVGVGGAATGSVDTGQVVQHTAGIGAQIGSSVFKMFGPGVATQTGWLYPLSALALAWGLGALWHRRAARTDPELTGYLMWGVWLATFFAAFSLGSVNGHTYYMGVVAVALCALGGAGLMRAWRAYRAGGRRAWVLPAVTAANVGWCAALTLCYPHFFGWLAPAAIALCAVSLALVGTGAARVAHLPRTAVAGAALGLAALLLIPAAWSASALSPRYNEAGGMGRVGPTSRPGGGPLRLTAKQQRFLAYLTAHRDGARYLAAVPGWGDAAPYILTANAPMLPMGGFTGHVPFPTSALLRRLVDSGDLRYVALQHPPAADRHHTPAPPNTEVTRWVTAHCTPVPPTVYGGPGLPLLHRCAAAAGTARDLTVQARR